MQLKRIALILPLLMGGLYASELNVTTDVIVENLTIESGDKMILSTGITLTVNGNVVITGELEMADSSIVDAGGDVTVTGVLDMDGTSRLKMTGDLTFTAGTLEADAGTGIDLDGGAAQTVAGTVIGNFKSLTRRGNPTIFDITATIEDSLDAGGQAFTISAGKTLTMDAGSVVEISGGAWTRTGTLALDADSKVLYTTGANSTMTPEVYGHIEHNGGILSQDGALTIVGTFTNTSGNFVASEDITASGIVWTAGSVTGAPSQTWDIGTDGITIDGGIFLATT